MTETTIIFIYNADTGFWNQSLDFAHKIFKPSTYSCSLCQLTHGVFKEKSKWSKFLKELPYQTKFYHRDEFSLDLPHLNLIPPVILIQTSREPNTNVFLSSSEIRNCETLDNLIQKFKERIASIE